MMFEYYFDINLFCEEIVEIHLLVISIVYSNVKKATTEMISRCFG